MTAVEELANGVTASQATDAPTLKCNTYCERPYCFRVRGISFMRRRFPAAMWPTEKSGNMHPASSAPGDSTSSSGDTSR